MNNHDYTLNIKLTKGTKKADNKVRTDIVEDKIIRKIDKYKDRKQMRKAKKNG